MRLYHVASITSVLDRPVAGNEDETAISHYTRSYYVVAENEDDVLSLIRLEERESGASLLDCERPVATDPAMLPKALNRDLGVRGVKWKSGRVFFPA